jgi:hypothetical protein
MYFRRACDTFPRLDDLGSLAAQLRDGTSRRGEEPASSSQNLCANIQHLYTLFYEVLNKSLEHEQPVWVLFLSISDSTINFTNFPSSVHVFFQSFICTFSSTIKSRTERKKWRKGGYPNVKIPAKILLKNVLTPNKPRKIKKSNNFFVHFWF